MHTARSDATATLLKNGKVLIAGGGNLADMYNLDIYASAELYDPATGKFTPTGSMTAARADATATLLNNGKVLIAGGRGCSDPKHCSNVAIASGAGGENLASAELYDPATGKFTRTGSMAAPRAYATSTLLPDGRILLDGFTASAELYDPHTGKFASTGQYEAVASGYNTATLLPGGQVLATHAQGGDSPLSSSETQALLYDETRGKFTTVSLALPRGTPSVKVHGVTVPRTAPTAATLLPDGRVLLYEGGYLETYDSTSGVCADAGFISPGAEWFGASTTQLAEGLVLFEGGSLEDPVSYAFANTRTAALYDPTGGPVRTGTTQVARWGQTATLLPDGSVLMAGGDDTDHNPFSSAELFKP
jgi:hypothetical protein